jgi:hypothetical protein
MSACFAPHHELASIAPAAQLQLPEENTSGYDGRTLRHLAASAKRGTKGL